MRNSSRPGIIDVEAHAVAMELNQLLQGETLYSDGWTVDKPWLDKLFYRCAMPMRFHVSPLEAILSLEQMEVWAATMEDTRRMLNARRHRASMDALVIQETFVQTRSRIQHKFAMR